MYNNNTLKSKCVLHDVLSILAKDFLILTPESIRTYAHIIEATLSYTDVIDPKTLQLAHLLTEHFRQSENKVCQEALVPVLQSFHNKFVAVPNAKKYLAQTLSQLKEQVNERWLAQHIQSRMQDDDFVNHASTTLIHTLDTFIKNEFMLKTFQTDFGFLETSLLKRGIEEPGFSHYREKIFRPTTLPYLFTLHSESYFVFQLFIKLFDEISAINNNNLYTAREKLLKIVAQFNQFTEPKWLLQTNISQLFSPDELTHTDVPYKEKLYDNLPKSLNFSCQFLTLLNKNVEQVVHLIFAAKREAKSEIKPAATLSNGAEISTNKVASFYEQGRKWMLKWLPSAAEKSLANQQNTSVRTSANVIKH